MFCPFIRFENKIATCVIHDAKPAVCAQYRCIDRPEDELNPTNCYEKTFTVLRQDWLKYLQDVTHEETYTSGMLITFSVDNARTQFSEYDPDGMQDDFLLEYEDEYYIGRRRAPTLQEAILNIEYDPRFWIRWEQDEFEERSQVLHNEFKELKEQAQMLRDRQNELEEQQKHIRRNPKELKKLLTKFKELEEQYQKLDERHKELQHHLHNHEEQLRKFQEKYKK